MNIPTNRNELIDMIEQEAFGEKHGRKQAVMETMHEIICRQQGELLVLEKRCKKMLSVLRKLSNSPCARIDAREWVRYLEKKNKQSTKTKTV